MRRGSTVVTALALILSATGCHNLRYSNLGAECPPADGCQPGNEEIVVHAPQQRVVVKTPPCPSENCQNVTGAPQGVPAAPQGVPGAPQGVPGSPQGVTGTPQGLVGVPQGVVGFGAQPFGVQPMGVTGGVPFGLGGVSNATVSTKQKTRFALAMTTIQIPVPWIKLVPLTEAPETTIKISGTQTTQAQGFTGIPMGVSGIPMGVGAGSLQGVPGSFIQGQVVGSPVAQGIQTQGIQAQGIQAQGAGSACPPCPPCPPTNPSGITPERIQALTKKIEELEAAKKALDEAKKKDPDPAPTPKEK